MGHSQRIQYGRVVHAFIRAGWNPPRPGDRATARLLDALSEARTDATLDLAPRQEQVVRLIAEGHTYDEIAKKLDIAHSSVRQAQKGAFQRLGARNSAHAVAICFRRGLLD